MYLNMLLSQLNWYARSINIGDQEAATAIQGSFSWSAMSLIRSICGGVGVLEVWWTTTPRWWECFGSLPRLFYSVFFHDGDAAATS
jgi:hypothetical protein